MNRKREELKMRSHEEEKQTAEKTGTWGVLPVSLTSELETQRR